MREPSWKSHMFYALVLVVAKLEHAHIKIHQAAHSILVHFTECVIPARECHQKDLTAS